MSRAGIGTAPHKNGRVWAQKDGTCDLLGPLVPGGCLQSAPGLRRRPAAALEAQSSLQVQMDTLGISHCFLNEVETSPLALIITKG